MESGLAALRLLVVDDNQQMRTIIGSMLAGAGVRHLHYAPDGRKAIQAMEQTPVDVVYVDYEMPEMNGLKFLSAVRARGAPHRFVPIIMLTGHADRPRIDAARDLGVSEFLCKPVTAKALLARLEAVIMRARPFVDCPTYFGPDRRRVRRRDYTGPMRRASDHQPVMEI